MSEKKNITNAGIKRIFLQSNTDKRISAEAIDALRIALDEIGSDIAKQAGRIAEEAGLKTITLEHLNQALE